MNFYIFLYFSIAFYLISHLIFLLDFIERKKRIPSYTEYKEFDIEQGKRRSIRWLKQTSCVFFLIAIYLFWEAYSK